VHKFEKIDLVGCPNVTDFITGERADIADAAGVEHLKKIESFTAQTFLRVSGDLFFESLGTSRPNVL
jgi:hypothetical protein